jgi:hypothetical protein
MILAKKGAMMKPMMLATMIEPKIELTVPPPCRMASMVATPANDTPWMSGSFEPMKPKADALNEGGEAADEQARCHHLSAFSG